MVSKSRVPAPLRVIGRSIVDWWDGWLDMVMVSIVWFFAQLTIVLGPPATFGFFYVVHQMANGEALGVRGLISGGRRFFGKAWLWAALNLVVILLAVVNIMFYGNIQAVWGLYLEILIIVLVVFWIGTNFYVLAYFQELQDHSLKVAYGNGWRTAAAAPIFTLVLLVLSVIVVALSFAFIIPIFLGLLGLIPWLAFRGMYNRLEAFGLRKPEKTPKEIEIEEEDRAHKPQVLEKTHAGAGRGAQAGDEPVGAEDIKVEEEE